MDRGNDPILEAYAAGHLLSLSPLLEEQLALDAEQGNEVQLARKLSYYGVVQLLLADHYVSSILYRQIYEEYARQPDDIRVRASYARYLALYTAFSGRMEEASSYYQECFACYEQIDWYQDEAFMILESISWFSMFLEDPSLLYQGLERLNVLCGKGWDWIMEEIPSIRQAHRALQQLDSPGTLSFPPVQQGGRSLFFSREILKALWCLDQLNLLIHQPGAHIPGHVLDQLVIWREWYSNHPATKAPLPDWIADLMEVILMFSHWQHRRGTHQNKLLHDKLLQDKLYSQEAKANSFKHPWFRDAARRLRESFPIGRQKACGHIGTGRIADTNIHRFTVTLFGSFAIHWNGAELERNWGTSIVRQFFVYMILRPDGQVPKDVVIEEFFRGEDARKSSNRLYVTIHRMNRFFQELAGSADLQVVYIKQGIVYVNQEVLSAVDIHTYRKKLYAANQLWMNDCEAAAQLMNEACQIYSPDLAPELLYLDWMELIREEIRQLQYKALRKLSQFYFNKNSYKHYEEVMHQLLDLSSFDESLFEEYIRYLLSLDRRAEALHWYDKLAVGLEEDLGLTPSAVLHQLISSIHRYQ